MFSYTIRFDTKLPVDTTDIARYPFDSARLNIKFELSHFETKEQDKKFVWRFDVYPSNDWLSWKPDVNGLSDFGISYEKSN